MAWRLAGLAGWFFSDGLGTADGLEVPKKTIRTEQDKKDKEERTRKGHDDKWID